MTQFQITDLPLTGLKKIHLSKFSDHRGSFQKLFSEDVFQSTKASFGIAQVNHSFTSQRATVRGLHFQVPPFVESKVIYCIKGAVFDVAVDLRKGSTSYLEWHAEILSSENQIGQWLPEGFAHGFQALTDDVELLYLHNAPYKKSSEGVLNPQDPMLGIAWPLPLLNMSDRDQAAQMIKASGFEGIEL